MQEKNCIRVCRRKCIRVRSKKDVSEFARKKVYQSLQKQELPEEQRVQNLLAKRDHLFREVPFWGFLYLHFSICTRPAEFENWLVSLAELQTTKYKVQ